MKCPTCGYQKRNDRYVVEEPIRFKSGKRKGEIKETQKRTIEPDKHLPNFHRLFFEKDVDRIMVDQTEYSTPFISAYVEADLVACPECGTVIVSNIT